tara:strand:- start:222 stop:656 length:435 start_codon:yes stop_codon:yes gene_type:complete
MKPNEGDKSYLKTKKKGDVTINPKKEDLMSEKKLDPVGREDKDIDNDGDHDKSDRYLLNRRRVRGKVIKMRKESLDELRSRRAKKPEGEGAVDTTPEVEVEEACETPAKKSIDTSEAKAKSKDRMKQKMMQATADYDRRRKGLN